MGFFRWNGWNKHGQGLDPRMRWSYPRKKWAGRMAEMGTASTKSSRRNKLCMLQEDKGNL